MSQSVTWRKCSEEMPKADEWVLVWQGWRVSRACAFQGEWYDANDSIGYVSHWMPLPDPPVTTLDGEEMDG